MEPDRYYGSFGAGAYSYQSPQVSVFGIRPGEGGALGGVAQMFAPMVSEFFRNQYGIHGFTFGSDMNVESTVYARENLTRMMNARAAGAQADRAQLERLMRGFAVTTGMFDVNRAATDADPFGRTIFTDEGERTLSVMTRDMAKMLPFLAANPQLANAIDMATPGGSRTVADPLIANAGRYVLDPLTGKTAADDPEYANRILNPLLADGRRGVAGLRAGQIGSLYEELSRMGLVGGEVGRGGAAAGALGGAMGAAAGRDLNESAVRDTLGRYSKAVAALKDIFAENGKGDATIPELIRGLQELTNGGMGRMSDDQLATVARTYQGVSNTFGINIQALSQMTGASSQLLAQYGGSQLLASNNTIMTASAREAFRARGLLGTGPEGLTQEDLFQLMQDKQAAFAGSAAGNQFGAILYSARFADPNSDLGKAAAALSNGQTTVNLGNGRSIDLANATQASLVELATNSGLTAQTFLGQLNNGAQNQAALASQTAAVRAGFINAQKAEYDLRFRTMAGSQQSLVGVNINEAMRLLRQAELDPSLNTDDKKVGWVSQQMGLNKDQTGQLNNVYAQVGMQYGLSVGRTDLTGGMAGQMTNPAAMAETLAARDRSIRVGERFGDVSHLGRGNILMQGAEWFAEQGQTGAEGGWMRLLLNGVSGGIQQSRVTRARASGVVGGDAIKQLGALADASSELGGFLGLINPAELAIQGLASATPTQRAAAQAGPGGTLTPGGSWKIGGELRIIEPDGRARQATINAESAVIGGAAAAGGR